MPAEQLPPMLEADVAQGIVAGLPEIGRAFREARSGFLTLVSELGPSDWTRPSRCHLWSVHDVVRHVRDGSKLHIELLHGAPPEFRPDDPFDNREIALRWLARTDGEQPSDTIRDLEQLVPVELDALAARIEDGDDGSYVGPYGRAHWTVLSTHVLWDAWLHARDITEPLERPSATTLHPDLVAALYGMLVASISAGAFEESLDARVRLTAASGDEVDLAVRPRHVTLQPARPTEAADLTGELGAVVDALTGRGPPLETVLVGSRAHQQPFTLLRHFIAPEDG